MCITFFYIGERTIDDNEDSCIPYRLILASNRDEWLDRSSEPMKYRPEGILAGRDNVAGGMWLGVTKTGKFAFVTNVIISSSFSCLPLPLKVWKLILLIVVIAFFSIGIYSGLKVFISAAVAFITAFFIINHHLGLNEQVRTLQSRGALVSNFLEESISASRYAEKLKQKRHEYGPFNLVIGDLNSVEYVTNSMEPPVVSLPSGIYGISNALLDTPWEKLIRGKSIFTKILFNVSRSKLISSEWEQLLGNDMMSLLGDTHQCNPPLGPGMPSESVDSSCRIHLDPKFRLREGSKELYGTRTSTVILINRSGQITVHEKTYKMDQERVVSNVQVFVLSA